MDDQAALAEHRRGPPHSGVGHPAVAGQLAFGRQAGARFEHSRLDARLDPVGDPYIATLPWVVMTVLRSCPGAG